MKRRQQPRLLSSQHIEFATVFCRRLVGQGTLLASLTSAIGYGVRDWYRARFNSSAPSKPL